MNEAIFLISMFFCQSSFQLCIVQVRLHEITTGKINSNKNRVLLPEFPRDGEIAFRSIRGNWNPVNESFGQKPTRNSIGKHSMNSGARIRNRYTALRFRLVRTIGNTGCSLFILSVRACRVFRGCFREDFTSRMNIRRSKLIRGDAGREKKGEAGEFVLLSTTTSECMHLPLSLRLLPQERGENANKATSKRPKLRGKNKNVRRRTKPHSGLPGRRTKRLAARRSLGSRLEFSSSNEQSSFYSMRSSSPLSFVRRRLSSSSHSISSLFFSSAMLFVENLSLLSIVNDPILSRCNRIVIFL